MALTVYTRDEFRDIVLAHIRGRVTGANTARGSDYWHLATAIATVVHGDQAAAQYLAEQILPKTSEKRFLELHAYMRGLTRFPATAAVGKVVVKEDGGSAVAIPLGATLTHASGRRYTVTAGASTATAIWTSKDVAPGTTRSRIVVKPNASSIAVDDVFECDGTLCAVRAVAPDTGTPIAVDLYVPLPTVPSNGTPLTAVEGAVVQIAAAEPGAAGNLEPGDELTFESPPAGLSATATVLEMSGGGDVETDEELKARILDFMAERPGAGNRGDFRQWARETPGVRIADAFVYPGYRGPGSIDVIPFGLPGARITGTVVNAAIAAYLAEKASFQDDVRVVQLTEPAVATVDLTIEPAPGYEPDWSGTTLTVVLSGSTLTEVQLSSAPDAIEIGDRVLIKTSTLKPRLWQRTVVGKLSGAFGIVLDEPLPELPTDGAPVRSGGPLAQPVIDAIVALIDDLGPGDTSPSTRYPAPGSAYTHMLTRAAVYEAIMAIDGVANVIITHPAGDLGPATQTRIALGEFSIDF